MINRRLADAGRKTISALVPNESLSTVVRGSFWSFSPSLPRSGLKRKIAAVIVSMTLCFNAEAYFEQPWEEADGPIYQSQEIQIDFPESKRTHNTETKGLGNCVWTSILHAAYWQGIDDLYPLISWLDEGGGYPGKVDEILKKHAPNVEYSQYEGPDPEPIIRLALATGRIPCVTYGYGKFYEWQPISHMVNLTTFTGIGKDGLGSILDNNNEKYDTWMSGSSLIKRMKHPSGNAWVIVFHNPPPPPPPKNIE